MTEEEQKRLLDVVDATEKVILEETSDAEAERLVMKLAARIREAVRTMVGPA